MNFCTFAFMHDSPTFVFSMPDDSQGKLTRFAFSDPIAQWSVIRTSELRDSFSRVAEYQASGYYVAMALSYEAGKGFDAALATYEPHILPIAWFAVFAQAEEFQSAQWPFTLGPPIMQQDKANYVSVLQRVLAHIRAGDIYQANITTRAHCDFSGDAFSAFSALSEAVPMPYSAFVNTGAIQIISLSPELFLRKQGNKLFSKPMKGTASRKPSWESDEAARLALQSSEKDRAENTMIVDLMRNDLGRICVTGSVRTEKDYAVERFPTVHQMTTTVTGELADDRTVFEIFQATFPAGSITGAPKVRASQIVCESESSSRGIYCGSIGLFFPGGDFVCNVAIRTLEINGNCATLGIGSGIVADSNPDMEWDEVILKSKFVTQRPQSFGLYEAFRYAPSNGFQNLDDHLLRLERSCIYFGRPFPRERILSKLEELRLTLGDQPNRIRLDLDGDEISFKLIPEELGWTAGGITVMIPDQRVDPDDPRLYHKTTLRPEKYTLREKAKSLGAEECLYLNTRNEFTEGAIASMMFRIRGMWVTPALSCGLLPGVWRDHQLHEGRAQEGVVTFSDLASIQEICIGNSVRGEARVRRVILEDGSEVYRDDSA